MATRVSEPLALLKYIPLIQAHLSLPLDIILILIAELLPKVQEIQASRAKANSPDGIRDFLAAMRLDHVLPPVPPVSPRRFTVRGLFSFLVFLHLNASSSGQIHQLYG
jgi:hypothetical protein